MSNGQAGMGRKWVSGRVGKGNGMVRPEMGVEAEGEGEEIL